MKLDTTPYQISAAHHILIPLFKAVKDVRMEKLVVIRKVEEPTDWCHTIVVVAKLINHIRLCISITKLNKGIECELHQLESVDQTKARLGEECQVIPNLMQNQAIAK